MPYYDTIEEDLQRAKEILAEGRPDEVLHLGVMRADGGGSIYGKDIYAAYKLLESFVAEIECLQQDIETWRTRSINTGSQSRER